MKRFRHTLFATLPLACLLAALLGCGDESNPPQDVKNPTTPPVLEFDSEPEKATDTPAPEKSSSAPLANNAVKLASSEKSADGEWGTLTGRFVYDGTPPKLAPLKTAGNADCAMHQVPNETLVVGPKDGLANVVVYLRTKKPKVNPDYEETADAEVVLDNTQCHFVPHIVLLHNTQKLVIKNSDAFGHNSKLEPIINPGSNALIPAGGSVTEELKNEEGLPFPVGCNIHPWMHGYVLVRSNPYMAVSDKEGNFTIKDLPAGKDLEFQLWHEGSGYLNVGFKGGKTGKRGRVTMKLKPGENNVGDIMVKPSLLEK